MSEKLPTRLVAGSKPANKTPSPTPRARGLLLSGVIRHRRNKMIQHKPEAPYGQIDSRRELFDSRRVERQLATGARQLKTGL